MRDLGFHHRARGHGRKAVSGRPALRVELAVRRQRPGGEGLEQHPGVDEILVADLVEVVLAAVEGQVPPPVVRVAVELDEAPGLEGADHVGPGAHRDPQARLREVGPLPVGLLQDRPQPDDQRQLRVAAVEGEAHRALAGLLHPRHLGPRGRVARQALFVQRLHRPDHVLDRHRAAVREPRLGPQRELDPLAPGPDLDRFGQQAVERERLVPVSPHQRLENMRLHPPWRPTLQNVRIEAVEPPGLAEHDLPALGRIGIGVGQSHKIGWQGRLPVHSYGVQGLGDRRRRPEHRRQRDGPRGAPNACHIHHIPDSD